MPSISYIISAHSPARLDSMLCCIYSLRAQTVAPASQSIVVACNGPIDMWDDAGLDAWPSSWFDCPDSPDCYTSSELALAFWRKHLPKRVGDYLCFPSDDSYYVPTFAATMLAHAPADIIACDTLYDPRLNGHCYSVLDVQPRECRIDKTSFIIKTELFLRLGGFPCKDTSQHCDGLLIEHALASGATWAKAPGVMVVHN